MNKIMWVVGKWLGEVRDKSDTTSTMWEIQGVFDSEEKGLDVCEGHSDYFIGPVELNKPFPDERVEWEGCYYPEAEKEINTLAPSAKGTWKTIIVNGVEIKTQMKFKTYTDILQLTDPLLPFRADYTLTWSTKADKGIMHHGGKPVQVTEGMIFNATLTGDA